MWTSPDGLPFNLQLEQTGFAESPRAWFHFRVTGVSRNCKLSFTFRGLNNQLKLFE